MRGQTLPELDLLVATCWLVCFRPCCERPLRVLFPYYTRTQVVREEIGAYCLTVVANHVQGTGTGFLGFLNGGVETKTSLGHRGPWSSSVYPVNN